MLGKTAVPLLLLLALLLSGPWTASAASPPASADAVPAAMTHGACHETGGHPAPDEEMADCGGPLCQCACSVSPSLPMSALAALAPARPAPGLAAELGYRSRVAARHLRPPIA